MLRPIAPLLATALAVLVFAPTSMPAQNAANPARGARREQMQAALRASLTPGEMQRLRAAHQAARNDPAVAAARKAGDRRGARGAMREAMLKSDPGLAPIFDKVKAARRSARGKR